MTATAELAFPTDEDLDSIEEAVYQGFNELEDLIMRLERILNAYQEARTEKDVPRPTFETVGRLYNFEQTIRLDGGQFVNMADRLEGIVNQTNAMRGDWFPGASA